MTMARLKKVLKWNGEFVFYGSLAVGSVWLGFQFCDKLEQLLGQNDMTRGIFTVGADLVVGCYLFWMLGLVFKKYIEHWRGLSMMFVCLCVCLAWLATISTQKDVYGSSTTLFDKVKRNVYWITPNFETPYHATLIADDAFANCDMLKSVEVSNRVETIGKRAFSGCVRLEKVVIGNRVASIGDSAFYNCGSLKDVKMGSAIISIDKGAFENCRSLESVTIPSYVASIGDGAFYNCTSLTTIYCKAVTPPKLGGRGVFAYDVGGVGKFLECKIYVPKESLKAYQTAEVWSEYADRIVGYDF